MPVTTVLQSWKLKNVASVGHPTKGGSIMWQVCHGLYNLQIVSYTMNWLWKIRGKHLQLVIGWDSINNFTAAPDAALRMSCHFDLTLRPGQEHLRNRFLWQWRHRCLLYIETRGEINFQANMLWTIIQNEIETFFFCFEIHLFIKTVQFGIQIIGGNLKPWDPLDSPAGS